MSRALSIGVATAASLALVWSAAGRSPASAQLVRGDRGSLTFRHAFNGHDARRDAAWQIAPGPEGMGLIVGAAFCGTDAFLVDLQRAVVHRVDLARGAIAADIGVPASGAALRAPRGVAADCATRTIVVVDGSGATLFDADSGAVRRRLHQPPAFINSVGQAVVDADTHAVYVPGIWPGPRNRRIGYRLDLQTGAASAMMPAIEHG